MALSAGNLSKKIGRTLLHLPQDVIEFIQTKAANFINSAKMAEDYVPQNVSKQSVKEIKQRLTHYITLKQLPKYEYGHHDLTPREVVTVDKIHRQTDEANRNNLTRTQAYYEFYRNYPEIHWAFLAHMVSRNGGWNMTDLKGDLLPRIMDPDQIEHLFTFLERANALIFQDAYPQLLLYAESRKTNCNLFHLLNSFHVSCFMGVLWDYFWKNRSQSALLTIALIINEQNYIEKRVVQDASFKKNVTETLFFQIQSSIQLTQVVFPYGSVPHCKLAGLTLEDFSDLDERIEFGKKLYAILFGFPEIKSGAQSFAAHTRHSGSRADYWPQLYSRIKSSAPSSAYMKKLKGSQLADGATPFYSPAWIYAWQDQTVIAPIPGDWCTDTSCLSYLKSLRPPFSIEMEEEHCLSLNAIEFYIIARENLVGEP